METLSQIGPPDRHNPLTPGCLPSYNRGVRRAVPAAGRASEVVGRETERARIEAFNAALPQGVRLLTFRGEPGIGKTALWRDVIARCREAGFQVLVTRPAEEEKLLALGGLIDLFEHAGSPTEVLDGELDALARGRAVLHGLRSLASRAPTVVAIDDLQWLDSVSARALRYALRRLDREPVGIVATIRTSLTPVDPLAPLANLPPHRHETIDLGPLSLGALRRVLASTVESISRPTLLQIHKVSGGNPLYAIELARGLAHNSRARGAPGGFVLPDSLQGAIEGRLAAAPEELSPLLAAASALGRVSVRDVQRVLPEHDWELLLATAQEHGLLVVDENLEIRFSHPLLGSAVYGRLSPIARRSLHGRLAQIAPDPDARAHHLALSTDEPDSVVSDLLETASARAYGRGACDLAAELARHSLRLTPPDDPAAGRRATQEIVYLAAAGEANRALLLSDELVKSLPPGPVRAEALIQRAYLENDDLHTGEELLMRALEDAGENEPLRGRVLDEIGWLRGMFQGDIPAGIDHLRQSLEIADRVPDIRLRMTTLSALAVVEALSGAPHPDRMAAAVSLADELGSPPLGGGPRAQLGRLHLWAGDFGAARAIFEDLLEAFAQSGREFERPYRLYDMALLECAAGNFNVGDELVSRGIEAARDAENRHVQGWLLHPEALVHAWLGRAAEARSTVERLRNWAERRGERPSIARAHHILGLLALSEGSPGAATEPLVESVRLLDEMGVAHPGAFPALGDAVEALACARDIERAGVLMERLERQTGALGYPWLLAAVARGRGWMQLAQGDYMAAAALFEEAAQGFDRLGSRPDAGRASLGHGRALWRAGRRTLAAEVLAGAGALFSEMGATLWNSRALEELERAAPGRAAGELTVAETRLAALVAQGKRNREIADALFMSVATVEAHLTRIYRKLAIRSRSELARLVADGSIQLLDKVVTERR